ncbi:MAG: MFS transporter [Bacteroidota bacterium]
MTNKEPVQKEGWNFPKAFWVANSVELLERAAYYGMFVVITLYLSDVVGFTDIEAGWIAGIFSGGLYFLPTFSGAYADKIGFRKAIILAFSLLTVGYFALGIAPYKSTVIAALLIVMLGGSFIKSVITGTVAKETNKANRARAFSIFYAIVNIGAFLGKTVVYPLRMELGLVSINFFSAAMTGLAVIVVFFFYKSSHKQGEGKSLHELLQGLWRVVSNLRLVILIIIITGFWIIQHQLYASMPKYIIRMVGEHAAVSWIANVNPLVVFITVMFVTQMMRKKTALSSMTVGMFIMPLSAFLMSLGPWLLSMSGNEVSWFFGLHPFAVMMIIGIAFQGFAETFISPRFLEYFSIQAPKGEEGLYMGFSHLHSFLAAIIGFVISGYLLDAYCPDPKLLTEAEKLTAYDHSHYIWYIFAAIGLVSAIALMIYGMVVRRIDSKKSII